MSFTSNNPQDGRNKLIALLFIALALAGGAYWFVNQSKKAAQSAPAAVEQTTPAPTATEAPPPESRSDPAFDPHQNT